jgi:glycosyltransferase involved in cell wall biosynthesis
MQYPTVGYGWHLTPQVLSMAIPSVVTLHELSKAHILRKLSIYPFTVRSKHIIFTTAHERAFALRQAPWISGRSSVIPIGSNISAGPRIEAKRPREVVYFGLFRPEKGLEDVLELASLVKRMDLPLVIRLVGKAYPADSPYFRQLYQRSLDLPIRWDMDREDSAVADILAQAAVAYMPFPDGASGRRGSLLALLVNGAVTITTRGPQTPSELDQAVLFAESPDRALPLIRQVLDDQEFRARWSEKGRSYAARFSWEAIAAQHVQLYKKLLEFRRKM